MAQFNISEQLDADARELIHRFQEASRRSGAASDVGDSRERAFIDWLERYLGTDHRVVKGEVIDTTGVRSQQIDALVLNDFHPPIHGIFSAGPYLAEGVSWAIEVKPDLRDSRELERGVKQVASVKKLMRRLAGGDVVFGPGPSYPHFAIRIPVFLFAITSHEIAELCDELQKCHVQNGIAKELQVDGVVVLERGIIYNFKEADPNFCFPMDQYPGHYILGLVGGKPINSPLAGLLKLLAMTHRRQFYGVNITAYYIEQLTRLGSVAYFDQAAMQPKN
jgi:hypothetical protein